MKKILKLSVQLEFTHGVPIEETWIKIDTTFKDSHICYAQTKDIEIDIV